jgi:hypothetical protein
MSNKTWLDANATLNATLNAIPNNELNNELHESYESLDLYINTQELRKRSIDLFIPLSTRIAYLNEFYKKEPEQFGEIISCINGMYSFSRTVSLKSYIKLIATTESIPILYRIECSKNLNEEGYDMINQLCQHELFGELPTPIRVDTVLYLIKNDLKVSTTTEQISYKHDAREYLSTIVNDTTIETLYRFKLIQQLENVLKTSSELFYYYANEISKRFIESNYNHVFYRVICAQYIFQKCEEYLFPFVNTFLLETASMGDLDEDIRADACDILLAYGTPENVENARIILFVLGGGERARNNVFKNSQNVHNQKIEESVEKLIEFISIYQPVNVTPFSFEKVKEELEKLIEEQPSDKQEILKNAMIRITIDRAIYGKMNLTLIHIITKMWTYIQDSECKVELEKRLLEELIDSNNKCSSGYVSRIVNTLSGFGELSVQISFEDQIVSVLETRLNKKLNEEEKEEDMDLILDEMTLPVRFYEKRGNFLRFFRKHISKIREDMFQEFHNYISDDQYDLYFRKAIMHYEGVI